MTMVQVKKLRHDFGNVLKLIENGEEIGITKRGCLVAMMTPPRFKKHRKKIKMPNFRARLKKIFKGKKMSYNIILDERKSSKW